MLCGSDFLWWAIAWHESIICSPPSFRSKFTYGDRSISSTADAEARRAADCSNHDMVRVIDGGMKWETSYHDSRCETKCLNYRISTKRAEKEAGHWWRLSDAHGGWLAPIMIDGICRSHFVRDALFVPKTLGSSWRYIDASARFASSGRKNWMTDNIIWLKEIKWNAFQIAVIGSMLIIAYQ